jgi:hypothetical protein
VDELSGDAFDFSLPRSVEDLRIPKALVLDLVLRESLVQGRTSTVKLSSKLCIGPSVMQVLIEELRELRYLEVQGLEGRDYQLALTEAGRDQAVDRMSLCRYHGPAPVSLAHYSAVIRSQQADPKINIEALRDAFSDLVISDRLLREVGPAAIAGGAMFLYGPPGTGKSSIAERLLRIYGDHVLVPHAVEVDGQIISVYDPVVHRPYDEQPPEIDPRWMLCKRPFIIVGGELSPDKLDLAYQAASGTYLAPVQMQANNGVLVIDDFGRQAALTPAELLNRWIVPLDRHIDYLSLDYGMKFEVPFDAKIVFSTNLEPATLGDEAFFRRIQSKILIPTISDDQFDEVLRRVAIAQGVELTPDASTHLRWMSRELGDGDLRPYLPGSVCKILRAICTFEERPMLLDPSMIERIASMYFTHADHTSEDDLSAGVTIPKRDRPRDEVDSIDPDELLEADEPAPAPALFANAAAATKPSNGNGNGNGHGNGNGNGHAGADADPAEQWQSAAAKSLSVLDDAPESPGAF